MDTLTIVLIAIVAVFFMALHITYGVICRHIAGGKGHNESKHFWLGFFFGLIAIFIVLLKRPRTIVLNPTLQQNLMYLTWLRQWGGLSAKEFEREKKVLYWMNHHT